MECNFVDWTPLSTIILATLLSLYMVVVTSCDIMVCGDWKRSFFWVQTTKPQHIQCVLKSQNQ